MKRWPALVTSGLVVLTAAAALRAQDNREWITKKNFGNDVIYYLFVDRFADGYRRNNIPTFAYPDGSPADQWRRQHLPAMYDPTGLVLSLNQGGDLQGVIDRLDYFRQLGVTMIMLNPVFANLTGFMKTPRGDVSAYHGYWCKDWYRIDEHYSNGYREFLYQQKIDPGTGKIKATNLESTAVIQALAAKLSTLQPKPRVSERLFQCLYGLDKKQSQEAQKLACLIEDRDDLFLYYLGLVLPQAEQIRHPVLNQRVEQLKKLIAGRRLDEPSQFSTLDLSWLRRRFLDLSDDRLIWRLTDLAHSQEYKLKILFDFPVNSSGPDDDWGMAAAAEKGQPGSAGGAKKVAGQDGLADYELLERPIVYRDRMIVRNAAGETVGEYDHRRPSEFFHSAAGWIDRMLGRTPVDRTIDWSKRYVPKTELENYKLHNLPDLNHENPLVRKYLIDAVLKWIALGVDGYRLDAAKHVPSEFISELEKRGTEADPDLVLIAEYYLGGVGNRTSLNWMKDVGRASDEWRKNRFGWQRILGSGTSVTLFDFSFALPVRKYFAGITDPQGRGSMVRAVLEKSENLITSNWLQYMDGAEDMEFVTLLESHDLRPMRSEFDGSLGESSYLSAVKFMFLSRGVPLVYYGMEQERYVSYRYMKGIRGIGEDQFYRLPIDWAAFDPNTRTYETYQRLAWLRQHNLALRYGDTRILQAGNESFVFERSYSDKSRRDLAFYGYSREGERYSFVVSLPPGRYKDPVSRKSYYIGRNISLFGKPYSILTIDFEPNESVILEWSSLDKKDLEQGHVLSPEGS